jgi:hypothetical protein
MGSLIPLSFICGIVAGVLIWRGGEMSKRTQEVEARLRGALERERRSLVDGDDHTGLGSDGVQEDEPTREKQAAHTDVRGSSNGVKHSSFDAREHGIEPQNKSGDGEEGLAGEAPVLHAPLKTVRAEASTSDVDRLPPGKPEQLHESSQDISATSHPSHHQEAYEKV